MKADAEEAKAVFERILETESPEQRQALLDRECAGNPQLRGRVEGLLFAYDDAGSFLESPPVTIDKTKLQGNQERPGAQIGPYKLLQQIGEGGFGTVFMAEQIEPVVRRVALKVIKLGMDTGQVLARFDAEQQALAMMDHPNIAKVFDAGSTESGRPYFVMELVNGIPFTEYCDEHRLKMRERLDLFLPVCKAIAHAHQKGIIHRDIKPSNVLVAEYDHIPTPKVIDFGIAKATNQRLTDKTLFTQHGQLVGTLEYMSPEQAKLNQLDVDTRSDIYSLGVLLYELLSGSTPFDRRRLQSAAFDEVLRIIREEDPPTPSIRLSTNASAREMSEKRKSDPKSLSHSLHGDLDCIVMKALAKERQGRYATAPELADDIQRYLDDEPIEARPPSRLSRVRRFVRRNKVPVVFSTIALMSAIIAAGFAVNARTNRLEVAQKQAELEMKETIAAGRLAETQLTRRMLEQEREQHAREKQVNRVSQLASKSVASRIVSPEQGLLLGIHSVELSRQHDDAVFSVAHETLLNSAAELSGQAPGNRQWANYYGHALTSNCLISPSWSEEGSIISYWDLRKERPFDTPPETLGSKRKVAMLMSNDGKRLVTGGDGLELWRIDDDKPTLVEELSPDHFDGTPFGSKFRISPNGRWLVVWSADEGENKGLVRTWNLDNPEQEPVSHGKLPAFRMLGDSLFITNDGRWLAIAVEYEEYHYTNQLWDLNQETPSESPLILNSDLDSTKYMHLVAISPNCRWLATSYGRVLDLTKEDPTSATLQLGVDTRTMVFSPNSDMLFTTNPAGTLGWDLTKLQNEAGNHKPIVFQSHDAGVSGITISQDGDWLATCGTFHDVFCWNLNAPDPAATCRVFRHSNLNTSVAISPDGRWIGVGGVAPRYWDLQSPDPGVSRLLLRRSNPSRGMHDTTHTAVSTSGRWIAVARQNQVELWDTSANRPSAYARIFSDLPDEVSSLAISDDERWLVATCDDGMSRVWDLSLNNVASQSKDFRPTGIDLTAADDGKIDFHSTVSGRWLFTGGISGDILQWDLQTSDATTTDPIRRHRSGRVRGLSASGDMLASASVEMGIRVWDLSNQAEPTVRTLIGKDGDYGTTLVFDKNQDWMAEASSSDVRMWNLRDKSQTPTTLWQRKPGAGKQGIWQMAMSPNARWVFATRHSGDAQLWDMSTQPPTGHKLSGQVQCAKISADNRWLVTTHRHGNVQLWDLKAGVFEDVRSSLRVLTGHDGTVWKAEFSADSEWLVTFGSDGTIRRWMLNTDDLLRYSKNIAGRQLWPDERVLFGIDDADE